MGEFDRPLIGRSASESTATPVNVLPRAGGARLVAASGDQCCRQRSVLASDRRFDDTGAIAGERRDVVVVVDTEGSSPLLVGTHDGPSHCGGPSE